MKRNSIAVFTWKGDLPTDEEVGADPATLYSDDYGEQWAYQSCQPVAVALLEALRELGCQTDSESPFYGELGRHFLVQIGDEHYSIFVQWIPKGARNDSFAVQPGVHRGCLMTLFARAPDESRLRPICKALQDALDRRPQFADVEWVNEMPY